MMAISSRKILERGNAVHIACLKVGDLVPTAQVCYQYPYDFATRHSIAPSRKIGAFCKYGNDYHQMALVPMGPLDRTLHQFLAIPCSTGIGVKVVAVLGTSQVARKG